MNKCRDCDSRCPCSAVLRSVGADEPSAESNESPTRSEETPASPAEEPANPAESR